MPYSLIELVNSSSSSAVKIFLGCAGFGITIATGNMTPTYRVLPDGTIRPVHFYMVDTSEFAANKLGDRGSLSAKGIVTNVQDFMRNISTGLGI